MGEGVVSIPYRYALNKDDAGFGTGTTSSFQFLIGTL